MKLIELGVGYMSLLKGNLATFGLPDLFQHLSQNKKYGILRIFDPSSEKKLVFQPNGFTLLSSGTRKGKEIGKLLVYYQYITFNQLHSALNYQSRLKSQSVLGQVLIEMGLVNAEIINKVTLDQIKEEIYDLFSWESANFEFSEDLNEISKLNLDPNLVIQNEDIAGTILESLQRIDEWKVIKEDIPYLDAVYVPINVAPEELFNLQTEDALRLILDAAYTPESARFQVLALLDGVNTFEEIIQKAYLPRFTVLIELCNLIRQNQIRLASLSEVVYLAKPHLEDKSRVSKAYIYAYPQYAKSKDLVLQASEILKFFLKNTNLQGLFKYDLLKETLPTAQLLLQNSYFEDAFQLLKEGHPLFGTDFEFNLLYGEALWRFDKLEKALSLFWPLAKTAKEQGEFRKLKRFYDQAYKMDRTHPLTLKMKLLVDPPEKKTFRRILFVLLLLIGGCIGLYFHLRTQAEAQSKELLQTIETEYKGLSEDYAAHLYELFEKKSYLEGLQIFRELQLAKSFSEDILNRIQEFKESNHIYQLQTSFETIVQKIKNDQTLFQEQETRCKTYIEEKQIKLVKDFSEILKEGKWNSFLSEFKSAELLLKPLMDYEIRSTVTETTEPFTLENTAIQFKGFSEGLSLNFYGTPPSQKEKALEDFKQQIRELFASAEGLFLESEKAKEHLKNAQEIWNDAVKHKSFNIFSKCFRVYQKMYQEIRETDSHRYSQVPLLLIPTFDKDLEPELVKLKDFPPELVLQLKDEEGKDLLQQTLLLEDTGENVFLCQYPLPIRTSQKKTQLSLEIRYPGFKTIQETIILKEILVKNQLKYEIKMRREHFNLPYPAVETVLTYPPEELLLLFSFEQTKGILRAVTLKGDLLWELSFNGRIYFPTLYKNYLFFNVSQQQTDHGESYCYLYTIDSRPREICFQKIEGSVRSAACFFPEQRLLCFVGAFQRSNKTVGCIRFHALEDLSEKKSPFILKKGLITTGIVHDSVEHLYFGTNTNEFFAYSIEKQKNLWKKDGIPDGIQFSFNPFLSDTSVLTLNHTKNSSYLLSFDLRDGKENKVSGLESRVPFSPQTYQETLTITTLNKCFVHETHDTFQLIHFYRSLQKMVSSGICDGKFTYCFTEDRTLLGINHQGFLAWKYIPNDKIFDPASGTIQPSGNPVLLNQHFILPFEKALFVIPLSP